MSVRRNSFANFVGVAYGSAAALLIVPQYLHHMSPEAFGLIGFFVLAQSWLALLDMGFSQVIVRAAAVHGRESPGDFRKLLASVEWLFLALAIAVVLIGFMLAPAVARFWLQISTLSLDDVERALDWMVIAISLRLWTALYKSCLQGLELQIRLNVLNVATSTLRYPGAFVLVAVYDAGFIEFFLYQAAVAVVELLAAVIMVYVLLPARHRWQLRFAGRELHEVLPFALSIAYGSTLSALLLQVDRLTFSSVLPLAEFGFLSTVTLIATGIVQLGGPVVQALLPRLTALFAADGDGSTFRNLYLDGAEALALLLAPIAITIAFFGQPLLRIWTGSEQAALWGAWPLFWYTLGSLIMTFATGPYLLQYVRGSLRLHTIFLSVGALIQTPVLVFLAFHYDASFVALVWCLFRAVDLVLWGGIVHWRLMPGLFLPWLLRCAGPVLSSLVVVLPAFWLLGTGLPTHPAVSVLLMGGVGLASMLLAVALSPLGRRQCRVVWSWLV